MHEIVANLLLNRRREREGGADRLAFPARCLAAPLA